MNALVSENKVLMITSKEYLRVQPFLENSLSSEHFMDAFHLSSEDIMLSLGHRGVKSERCGISLRFCNDGEAGGGGSKIMIVEFFSLFYVPRYCYFLQF